MVMKLSAESHGLTRSLPSLAAFALTAAAPTSAAYGSLAVPSSFLAPRLSSVARCAPSGEWQTLKPARLGR